MLPPVKGIFSKITTFVAPFCAASIAALIPAPPAPITTISADFTSIFSLTSLPRAFSKAFFNALFKAVEVTVAPLTESISVSSAVFICALSFSTAAPPISGVSLDPSNEIFSIPLSPTVTMAFTLPPNPFSVAEYVPAIYLILSFIVFLIPSVTGKAIIIVITAAKIIKQSPKVLPLFRFFGCLPI